MGTCTAGNRCEANFRRCEPPLVASGVVSCKRDTTANGAECQNVEKEEEKKNIFNIYHMHILPRYLFSYGWYKFQQHFERPKLFYLLMRQSSPDGAVTNIIDHQRAVEVIVISQQQNSAVAICAPANQPLQPPVGKTTVQWPSLAQPSGQMSRTRMS